MSEEMLDVVDASDHVIDSMPRSIVRRDNLLHRSTGILCFNSAGELYVHRRTETKDLYPGLYDVFAGGAVATGESYDGSAQRELAEELGIELPVSAFEPLMRGRFEDAHNNIFSQLYRVRWDGPLRHQPEEVAWGAFMSVDTVTNNPEGLAFVPDGRALFLEALRFILPENESR